MKQYVMDFLKRGLMAAAGGPLVLAIIYGILGQTGVIDVLTPGTVCRGILTVTLLAFIAAGITMIYSIERLPLLSAIVIHAGVLYLDYILIYLLNGWLKSQIGPILIFTAIFLGGYGLIWLGIYCYTKAKTDRINAKLRGELL